MSGIFGFVNFDGRPASPEEFQKMAGEMAHWGPDGIGSVISGSATMGHALLIVTHESPYEKMPYHDTETDVLFTAAARLDNRDELCDLFGIPHPQRPTTPDGRLVWLAWRKWGTDSCRYIFGDWSFAAWDKKEKKLFLARDHLGNTGLYYYFKPPLIVFASNVKAVLAHQAVPCELDEIHLGRKLGLNILEDEVYRTYWQGVHTLPAAHTASFGNAGKTIENFWRMTDAPDIRFSNDQDYLDGFLDHFRRAVRVRLNSIRPVASTLSAGLDSSAVTALAAQELKKRNQPLVAYTSVPLYSCDHLFPGNITDEWPLAHEVARLHDNIEHIPIKGEDITTLAGIEKCIKINNMPAGAPSNSFWIISILQNAKHRNKGIMLTGQLGNGGVSWSGGLNRVLYLLAQNQWCNGLQTMIDWKVYNNRSWFGALKQHMLKPAIKPVWVMFKNAVGHAIPGHGLISLLNDDFVRRVLAQKRFRFHFERTISPQQERWLTMIRNGIIVGPSWHNYGSFYDIEVRDPTADVRLLEFCMGIPNEQYYLAGGERMLIRTAMAGILPDSIRSNTLKGRQASDIMFRLEERRDEMQEALNSIESMADTGRYINVQSMRQEWLEILQRFPHPDAVKTYKLLRVLNVGYFLVSFSGNKKKSEE
jgi:asparagine synthase (glutamine-hydrolysing)